MAIKYYPNRVFKGKVPAIDRTMAKRQTETSQGNKNILASALDVTISSNEASGWQIDSIGFSFDAATARNYSAKIKNGRKVVSDLNDYLWLQMTTTLPQRIILDAGFYNGTELATELQTQMNANTAFAAYGVTFTVAYDATTGLFTITPSTGMVRYLDTNPSQTLRTTDSIAGHLFGLNEDSAFAASVSSDTAVGGLNSLADIINETASVVLNDFDDGTYILSIDQALILESNSGVNVSIDYTVVHEALV